jgi:hypothetical protein
MVPLPPKFEPIKKFLEILYVVKILRAGHLGLGPQIGPQIMGPTRCVVPNCIFLKGNAQEVL